MPELVQDPAVSVVIPVLRGGDAFARCVRSLANFETPPSEMIVVADGSNEDLRHVERLPNARIVRLPETRGPAAARNAGALCATGDVILFLDADVVAPVNLIRHVQERFRADPELAAVFGSYDDAPDAPSLISRYRNLLHHYVHQTARPAASTFWAGCGAIRRSVFENAGGFDEERYRIPSIEDIEMGYRLRRAGRQILLDRTMQVKHLKKWTLGSMVRTDIFQRGAPWTELILEAGGFTDDLNTNAAGRASVILVGLGLVSLVLSPLGILPALAAIASFAAFIYLNRAFFAFLRSKHGPGFALASVPLHALHYLCGATGFLVGLVRHGRRRFGAARDAAPERPSGGRKSVLERLLKVAIGALVIAYVLEASGPLRLDTDSIFYLSMAVSADEGSGFLVNGEDEGLPIGYSAVLLLLMKVDLAHPWFFAGLNLAGLLLGIWLCRRIYLQVFGHSRITSLVLCLLILVSFLFIKFASLPRPEIAFFAASIGCVSAIHWSAGTEGRRWPGMFVAMVLCAVSISLRTVGAALIPAVFAALVLRLFGGKGTMRRLRAGLLGPIVPLQFGMVATLLVLIALTQTDYFGRMLEIYASRGFLDRASRILELNLFNWGSLMANVPFEKAIDVMGQVGLGRTYATTIVQLLGLSGMLAGILSLLRWSRPGLVMNIYVLGFSAGLFVWPGAVVRLWMPIWPLILGYLAAAAIQMRRRPTGRLALGAWIVWMGITGLAGHAYSMRIAFAGEDFPARYGDGSLSSTYDAALNGRTGDERVVESDEDVTGPNDVYRDAYDLLVRFEPRVDEEVKRSGPLPR